MTLQSTHLTRAEIDTYQQLARSVIAQAHWDLGDRTHRRTATWFLRADNKLFRFWCSLAGLDPDKLDLSAVPPAVRYRERRRRKNKTWPNGKKYDADKV